MSKKNIKFLSFHQYFLNAINIMDSNDGLIFLLFFFKLLKLYIKLENNIKKHYIQYHYIKYRCPTIKRRCKI